LAIFEYTALTVGGQRVQGSLVGASEQAVLAELETRHLTPVAIKERLGGGGFRRGVSARALGESYEQVSDLLKAGVPLLRGLRVLSGRRSTPTLSAEYRRLADALEKGGDLASAMAESPRLFPPVHVAMVRAGERGGFLEEIFANLGRLVLKQAELRAKIIGNLIYPAILLVIGTGVGLALFIFFVPLFRPMFEQLRGGLPLVTRLVFATADALTVYGPFTLIFLALLAAGVWNMVRRPRVKEWIEGARLKLPIVGHLERSITAARLCRLLGSMLGNGVPMLAALQIAKDGVGNVVVRRALEQAAESVQAGQHLSPPLAASGLFEDDVVEMISVGEAANNLDDVLLKVALTLENRIDRVLNTVVRLIEPLMLLLLAGVIGLVAAGLLLPMSKLGGAV
jgi:general secretion pathway protein F